MGYPQIINWNNWNWNILQATIYLKDWYTTRYNISINSASYIYSPQKDKKHHISSLKRPQKRMKNAFFRWLSLHLKQSWRFKKITPTSLLKGIYGKYCSHNCRFWQTKTQLLEYAYIIWRIVGTIFTLYRYCIVAFCWGERRGRCQTLKSRDCWD